MQHPARAAETSDLRDATDDDPDRDSRRRSRRARGADRAFGSDEEADLVELLHADGDCRYRAGRRGRRSDRRSRAVQPAHDSDDRTRCWTGAALAPLAVLPEFERQGIGSALVREGLRLLRDSARVRRDCRSAIRRYYGRFGFSAERASSLRSRYSGPPSWRWIWAPAHWTASPAT